VFLCYADGACFLVMVRVLFYADGAAGACFAYSVHFFCAVGACYVLTVRAILLMVNVMVLMLRVFLKCLFDYLPILLYFFLLSVFYTE